MDGVELNLETLRLLFVAEHFVVSLMRKGGCYSTYYTFSSNRSRLESLDTIIQNIPLLKSFHPLIQPLGFVLACLLIPERVLH